MLYSSVTDYKRLKYLGAGALGIWDQLLFRLAVMNLPISVCVFLHPFRLRVLHMRACFLVVRRCDSSRVITHVWRFPSLGIISLGVGWLVWFILCCVVMLMTIEKLYCIHREVRDLLFQVVCNIYFCIRSSTFDSFLACLQSLNKEKAGTRPPELAVATCHVAWMYIRLFYNLMPSQLILVLFRRLIAKEKN